MVTKGKRGVGDGEREEGGEGRKQKKRKIEGEGEGDVMSMEGQSSFTVGEWSSELSETVRKGEENPGNR